MEELWGKLESLRIKFQKESVPLKKDTLKAEYKKLTNEFYSLPNGCMVIGYSVITMPKPPVPPIGYYA